MALPNTLDERAGYYIQFYQNGSWQTGTNCYYNRNTGNWSTHIESYLRTTSNTSDSGTIATISCLPNVSITGIKLSSIDKNGATTLSASNGNLLAGSSYNWVLEYMGTS